MAVRFHQVSSSGNQDMLIIYDYNINYIHVKTTKNKTRESITTTYKIGHHFLKPRGLIPKLHNLDN